MFRQLKKNKRGVILVTVIIISIIMSILAIGILSINTTQVRSGEQIKNDTIAELVARMVYWEVIANDLNGLNIANSATHVINNRSFVTAITPGPFLGNNVPRSYNIVVTYF